jgi:hypothetical protein
MKKIFALAIVVLAFASCKKDYTCTCKVSDSSTGTEITTPTEFNGLSKSDADAAKTSCESVNGSVGTITTSCTWSEK